MDGNPLESLPLETREMESKNLLKWVENFPKQKNIINYFHLVVVGDHLSGKSRLVCNLMGTEYKKNKEEKENVGLTVNDWVYQQNNSFSVFSVKIFYNIVVFLILFSLKTNKS